MVRGFRPTEEVRTGASEAPAEPKALRKAPSGQASVPGDSFESTTVSKQTQSAARRGEIEASKVLGGLKSVDVAQSARPFLFERDPATNNYKKPTAQDFFSRLVTHADKPEVQSWLNTQGRESLKSAVNQHAIESTVDQLMAAKENLPEGLAKSLGKKPMSKDELLQTLVESYATMPDLRPLMKQAAPEVTTILDRLNKLQQAK